MDPRALDRRANGAGDDQREHVVQCELEARCTSEQGYEIDNDRDDMIAPGTAGLGELATA